MDMGSMFPMPKLDSRISLDDVIINHDRTHGPWPEHLDMIQKLPQGGVEKVRVDMDGSILSNHVYYGPIKL